MTAGLDPSAATGEHGGMEVIRIIADIRVPDLETARSFYTDFLRLDLEEFNPGWVARYTAPEPNAYDSRVRIQVLTRDATAPVEPIASILTPDVDAAHEEARRRGYEIVHPLTHEPWDVHRFFVRAPDGNVFNIVGHSS